MTRPVGLGGIAVTPERVVIGNAELFHGDCQTVMRDMADNSVDAIITDPPYFRVKGEAWDNQWDTPAKFLLWVGELCEQFERILKPNGSLYFFASPQMAARVECEIGKRFAVLNSITWRKGAGGLDAASRGNAACKEALRGWFPTSERIVFAEHYGSDAAAMGESGYRNKCDEAARATFGKYITATRAKYMLTMKALTEAVGAYGAVNHGGACSNWENGNNIPTRDQYNKLKSTFPGYFAREYEDLRREYEDLRRPFSVTARDQWSDVWDFDPVQAYPGKHPCEKPQPLLCHILGASTRPGAVVFDPFAGGGSMGEACYSLGRQFIGVELCPDNYAKAALRLQAVKAQERLFA